MTKKKRVIHEGAYNKCNRQHSHYVFSIVKLKIQLSFPHMSHQNLFNFREWISLRTQHPIPHLFFDTRDFSKKNYNPEFGLKKKDYH